MRAPWLKSLPIHANGFRFSSTSVNIPVDDNADFPSSCIVRVNEEKIDIGSKSGNWTCEYDGEAMLFDAAEGYTLQGATHWSGTIGSGSEHDFDGHEVYLSNEDVPDAMDTGWVDYFGGCALVCVEGPGISNVYKITGFDPEAPYQWVPSQTYTLPDTWMDHVGDLSHGSWVQDDTLIRVFVEADRAVKTMDGSKYKIVPNLHVDERGYDGTTITTHGEETVSVDTDDTGSASIDLNTTALIWITPLVDMAKILCAKAGVHDVEADLRASATGSSYTRSLSLGSQDFILDVKDPGSSFVTWHQATDQEQPCMLACKFNLIVCTYTHTLILVRM